MLDAPPSGAGSLYGLEAAMPVLLLLLLLGRRVLAELLLPFCLLPLLSLRLLLLAGVAMGRPAFACEGEAGAGAVGRRGLLAEDCTGSSSGKPPQQDRNADRQWDRKSR
eukprot:1156235-Pelagomonas_calceolata.AAC.6